MHCCRTAGVARDVVRIVIGDCATDGARRRQQWLGLLGIMYVNEFLLVCICVFVCMGGGMCVCVYVCF